MSSWNRGYNTSLLYTYGFYKEMNPRHVLTMLTLSGFRTPNLVTGNSCELGFGQGVGLVLNAVASQNKWYGTDFNPTQTNFAQSLAKETPVEINIYDDSFDEFTKRKDLPEFDYIAFHGIWTWISRGLQDEIMALVDAKLKKGGVIYVSYNAAPGFLVEEPLRHVTHEFLDTYVTPNSTPDERLNMVRDFFEGLSKVEAAYIKEVPSGTGNFATALNKDSHYVYAEYFNDFWYPEHIIDIQRKYAKYGLTFACTATPQEHLYHSLVAEQTQGFLDQFKDTEFYETNLDLMTNRKFRRDLFIRGTKEEITLSPEEHKEACMNLHFISSIKQEDLNKVIKEKKLDRVDSKLYTPILQLLKDRKMHSFKELYELSLNNEELKDKQDKLFTDLIVLVKIFISTHIVEAVNPNVDPEVVQRCIDFNKVILNNNRYDSVAHLVCPLTECAMQIDGILRPMMHCYYKKPDINRKQLLEFVVQVVKANQQQGSRFTDGNGKVLKTDSQIKKHLKNIVDLFFDTILPILKNIKVVE